MLESFVLPKRCAIASLDTLRLGIKKPLVAASRVGYVLLCLCCCFGGLACFFAVLQGVDAYSGGLVAGDIYHGTHHVQNAVYASDQRDAFNGQARTGVP